MIPSAAPHHPDPKALPMNPVLTFATRAFAATRAMLALIGFAALTGYLLLPHTAQPKAWLAALPVFADAATVGAAAAAAPGAVPAAAVESPLEHEQRAVTEY